MEIIKSNVQDAELLTKVTIASKSYWNYDEELLKSWTNALTITENYILEKTVYKLVSDKTIIGYYSFFIDNDCIELDNLFVLPEYIGSGIGKRLLFDFLEKAKDLNFEKIILYSDPNSEGFYEKYGFKTIGQKATNQHDRFLPIMEKENNGCQRHSSANKLREQK